MNIEKNINQVIIVDSMPNSPNQHYKSFMADSKENY